MLTKLYKTPFPYFGGKADAAPAVWTALGDTLQERKHENDIDSSN